MHNKTTLSKLDFELLPKSQRQLRGTVLLVAGIVLASVAAGHYIQSSRKIAAIESEAGYFSMADVVEGKASPADIEEVALVRASIERLSLPWGSLFSALEKVDAEKVSLISLEPDPQKSIVKIVAEAPDVYEMLEYMRGLAAEPNFRDVLLTQYELRLETANQPVRFILIASWKPMP
jgi:hypothetical protein